MVFFIWNIKDHRSILSCMYEDTMLHQFSQVFIKAVKGEMDSMKQRLGSFELPVRYTGKKNDLHEFTLYSPTDKLNRAMQCTL